MSRKLIVLALGVVTAGGSPAQADTVWSQPGGSGGANAGTFWVSDNSLPQTMADRFDVSGPASITGVRWWGTAWDGQAKTGITHFVVEVFSVVGGLPGASQYSTTIASSSVATASDAAPDKPGGWRYDATISGCNLNAGDYYLAISAVTSSPNNTAQFLWQGLLDGGDGAAYKNATTSGAWTLTNLTTIDNLAFQLEGSIQNIPLPAPMLLGALGLAGVVPVRRRLMPRA